jgi:hypothetical protein
MNDFHVAETQAFISPGVELSLVASWVTVVCRYVRTHHSEGRDLRHLVTAQASSRSTLVGHSPLMSGVLTPNQRSLSIGRACLARLPISVQQTQAMQTIQSFP